MEETFDPYEKYANVKDLSKEDLLNHERDALGYYFSGHPVLAIKGMIDNLRTHTIGELTDDLSRVKIVGLLNSYRQIRDRSNKQVAFISFDDGTGTMEGIVSSEILEKYHLLLNTNSILIFAGSIEVDDYKSKELSRRMYKMKVGAVASLESQMNQGNKSIMIDARNLSNDFIQSNMTNLKNLNGDFWKHGNCKIHLKILHENSEAIIELGDEFKLLPSIENIKLLKDMFGDEVIKLNK